MQENLSKPTEQDLSVLDIKITKTINLRDYLKIVLKDEVLYKHKVALSEVLVFNKKIESTEEFSEYIKGLINNIFDKTETKNAEDSSKA